MMKKDNLFYSLVYFTTACIFLNAIIFCPPMVQPSIFEYCIVYSIVAAWFIGGFVMLKYFYNENKNNNNLQFIFSELETNNHGTNKPDEKWDGKTIHGWKIKRIKMNQDGYKYYFRAILYFPSGKCWYFDLVHNKPEGGNK